MAQEAKNQSSSSSSPSEDQGEQTLFAGAKQAIIGGLAAAGIAIGGQLLVGQVYSGTEARQLLEAMLPSTRSVSSSVVTASATILALMLTMLSLTNQANSKFDRRFYERIKHIGMLSSAALSGGILLLLFISLPLPESQNMDSGWYNNMYYILMALTAALAGLLVTLVLMLYNAMVGLLQVVSPSYYGAENPDAIRQASSQGEGSSTASSSSGPSA